MVKTAVESWDSGFFSRFISIRNSIYQDHLDFIPDSLEDLEIFFSSTSFFSQSVRWKAVIIEKDGRDVARYLLSMNSKSEHLYLGYFECRGEEALLKTEIFSDIQAFKMQFPQVNKIKGPIQGSLFGGYRFREPTTRPRFLGESLHLDSYPDLWKSWGFAVEEYWDSYEMNTQSAGKFYSAAKAQFEKFWVDPKILCRELRPSHWAQELRSIFAITLDAYKIKGTNDEIDEKIFATLSEKIRPLVTPETVKILEYDGKTVGFNICYLDIQSEIRHFNARKKYLPGLFNKIWLLLSIKLKQHPLLLVYVAKSADCPIKWAMANLACSMIDDTKKKNYPYLISALNAESAASRASLPPNKVLHSRHFLLELSI